MSGKRCGNGKVPRRSKEGLKKRPTVKLIQGEGAKKSTSKRTRKQRWSEKVKESE